MEQLKNAPKTVGVKQSRRVIRDGKAQAVYLALDAEERITRPLRDLCRECGAPLVEVPTMSALGEACGIDIGASVAVLLKV